MRDAKGKPIVLSGVRPNAGLRVAYERKLKKMIAEMDRSYRYWISAAWRANPPVMAQDETPAADLDRMIRKLGRKWNKKFDEGAEELAAYFADKTKRNGDIQLKAILKKAGFTVDLKLTRSMRDALKASIIENVGLIKSIPQQYHNDVRGLVMRSVTTGRDLEGLTDDLLERYDITKKRAVLIARDQNNKATAVIARTRYLDLGIEEAVWLHSAGGKTKRKTHVANSGKRYNIQTGWYDPDPRVRKHIMPGELVNCRCTAKPVVNGFS